MSNLSTEEELAALAALAAAITAESVTFSDWRQTKEAKTAAENAHDDEADDEQRKHLEVRVMGTAVYEELAEKSYDLALAVRKQLQVLCKRVGVI